MKKAFIQKLSIAMASALVITAAAPATADAAAAMKMNKSSKVLYLNEDNMTNTKDTYDFSIKNKPSNYKTKYSFSWYAENDKIVKVAKGGVVTAKKVGQTTVKCDIIKKSTGKVYKTVSATVTVKANAETVTIKNAPENGEIAVGTTFDFNRTMKAANGGAATDKTEWVLSADKDGKEATDIASVDKNGVVTALKAGTFYITAKTFQSASAKDLGYTAVSEAVEVKIPLQMTEVNLKKVNTVELTFDSSVKDVVKTAADVQIQTVAANKINIPVKAISVSEDGKTVTVESYQNFTNGTTYKLTAAGTSKEFTAQIGTIKDIVIANQTVAPITQLSDAKTLAYTVYDEYGVDVTASYPLSGLMTVISSSTNASYITSDGKLAMFNKGDVVSVQLKYLKYNTTTGADESVVSNVATITCADIAAASTSKWTISSNASGDYSTIKTSINVGQTGKYLNVTMKDNYNNDLTSGFTFTSLDESKLVIDMKTGKLTPIAAGSVVVKVECGGYVDYLTITVNPAASLSTLKASTTNVTLSNAIATSAGTVQENQTVTFTLTDNYGETFSTTDQATFTVIAASDAVTPSASNGEKVSFVDGKANITFTAASGKTGQGTYKLEVNGKIAVVTVTTKAPSGVVNYSVELDKTEADSYKSDVVNMKVYGVDASGTKAATTVTGTAMTYTVKNAAGETKLSGNYNEAGVALATAGLAAGTYNVYVNIGPITKTASFTVKSSQGATSFSKDKVTITNVADGANLNTVLGEAFTVKVGSATISDSALTFVVTPLNAAAVSGSVVNWGTETTLPVYVEKVTFSYTDGSGIAQNYSVDIKTTITLKK